MEMASSFVLLDKIMNVLANYPFASLFILMLESVLCLASFFILILQLTCFVCTCLVICFLLQSIWFLSLQLTGMDSSSKKKVTTKKKKKKRHNAYYSWTKEEDAALVERLGDMAEDRK